MRKYQAEEAETEFLHECLNSFTSFMDEKEITRAELARRLGTTRANISQMLAGRNVTLRSLAAACYVIGAEPHIVLRGKEIAK